MEGKKFIFVAIFCMCALISGVVSGKIVNKRSSGHGHGGSGDLSSETLLLRDKLNLILDAESKEVTLLKNMMDEENEHKRDQEKESEVEGGEDEEVKNGGNGGLEYLREQGIVTKLEENSKRMEKMVVFLVDLRNLLTEALTQQNRQMAMESELVEIREEMEFLRKELQTVKKDRTSSQHSSSSMNMMTNGHLESSSSIENQLHNEHATLEWLKTSTHELRTQISDLSSQCNATFLMTLRENVEKTAHLRDTNLVQTAKQVEMLRLGQMRQQEEINEATGNIEDLRSWQVKMGNKLARQLEQDGFGTGDDEGEKGRENNESNSVEEEHFITEAMKDAVGKQGNNMRHHQSHKRLKSKIYQLQKTMEDLSESNKNHERRLSKMESSQRTLKSLISSTATSSSIGSRRQQRSLDGYQQDSLNNLKKTMQEYTLTLESLNDKVEGMDELQESTKELFRSLEQLEKKYDDRVAEMQTGLARVESGMSGVIVSSEDLKEQQSQQSSVIQMVKKDLFQVKGQLQTNHLRLAGIQSEMVRWASHKCTDENKESIQNIRIATLEHALSKKQEDNDESSS